MSFDPTRIWEVLRAEQLDLVTVTLERQRRGEAVTVDEGALLTSAITIVLERLNAERTAAAHLAERHDELRQAHAVALSRLHHAHGKVARAAVAHRDEGLAALARDTLRGQPKAKTLEVLRTGTAILKAAREGRVLP